MKITRRWDVVAVAGEFESGGQTRRRYVRVGSLAETPTGPVIFLDAHINLAGFPRPEGQQSVLLSCYEPKTREYESDSRHADDDMPF